MSNDIGCKKLVVFQQPSKSWKFHCLMVNILFLELKNGISYYSCRKILCCHWFHVNVATMESLLTWPLSRYMDNQEKFMFLTFFSEISNLFFYHPLCNCNIARQSFVYRNQVNIILLPDKVLSLRKIEVSSNENSRLTLKVK